MQIDLDEMSREELQTLRKDVDKAIATVNARRRSEARAAAEKAAQEYGFRLEEITESTPAKGQKNAPKYRNPDEPKQTWSGRGRQPQWIKQGLEEGKTLEDYAI